MTPANGICKFDKILERALREGYNDESIQIIESNINPGSLTKINFLSDFFKTTLRYKKAGKNGDAECTVSVVIKSEPSNEQAALEIFRQQELFATEFKMYRDILPKIKRITSCKIGPRLLHASEDMETLVMEDLSVEGFKMLDQRKGLSLKHCLMVLGKMATLHGGSVALYEQDPELVKSLTGGILSSKCPKSFLRLIEVTVLNISREIRNWSNDGYLVCSEKLGKLADRIKDEVTKVYDYDSEEFCVVNHGDCWINNMMFKNDERGEPSDVLLVDYQMSVYTSPAIDLLYFLNICPQTALKCDKEDYFLKIYLAVLTNVMKAAGCVTKPPTIQDLKQAIYKRRTYAIFSGLVLFPRMMANNEDIESFDLVLGKLNGETRMDIFKQEEVVAVMRKLIIKMNERGYFD
ncbi:hypothetical protein KPH14_012423 [Odynerus spinipes]|uniref:CHK kinase-like domain-containing protein n=1 Tax=Odynerus spinipes TaxID=1348599 RepID=A0AAD9RIM3_9HYME|nr:hypothetical protein KPH14_012423 [Odynerus spinipes]